MNVCIPIELDSLCPSRTLSTCLSNVFFQVYDALEFSLLLGLDARVYGNTYYLVFYSFSTWSPPSSITRQTSPIGFKQLLPLVCNRSPGLAKCHSLSMYIAYNPSFFDTWMSIACHVSPIALHDPSSIIHVQQPTPTTCRSRFKPYLYSSFI